MRSRLTLSQGAKLLVLDIPTSVAEHPSAVERATTRWATSTRTDFLALRPAFCRLPPAQWSQLYDGHFTVAGHRATAEAIAEYISQHRLLDARP
jgi:hypothetical protein